MIHDRTHNPTPATARAPARATARATTILLAVAVVSAAGWVVGCQQDSPPLSLMSASASAAPGTRGYDLFQANCAACHGELGEGWGPAAIALDARPRDFWGEPFRYVSTLDAIPTQADLEQTIRSGRIHGGMPAAPWLSDDDVRELAAFVIELNRLGWVQRLSEDEALSERDIQDIATDRVTSVEPIEVVMPSAAFSPNSARGRELYAASCAACHGPTGEGDGLDKPLDENGRPIAVRDLTGDPIQGGDDPLELYKRIRCGVPGTPMPAQTALTDDDVWQLVFYTRELLGRPISHLK